jgi:hypothetical protein
LRLAGGLGDNLPVFREKWEADVADRTKRGSMAVKTTLMESECAYGR